MRNGYYSNYSGLCLLNSAATTPTSNETTKASIANLNMADGLLSLRIVRRRRDMRRMLGIGREEWGGALQEPPDAKGIASLEGKLRGELQNSRIV